MNTSPIDSTNHILTYSEIRPYDRRVIFIVHHHSTSSICCHPMIVLDHYVSHTANDSQANKHPFMSTYTTIPNISSKLPVDRNTPAAKQLSLPIHNCNLSLKELLCRFMFKHPKMIIGQNMAAMTVTNIITAVTALPTGTEIHSGFGVESG